MSLSPLLVATSSVENAVFSQYSNNNAPTRKRGGSSTPHSQPTLFIAFPISRTLSSKGNFHLEISVNTILQTDEDIPRQDQEKFRVSRRSCEIERAGNANFATAGSTGKRRETNRRDMYIPSVNETRKKSSRRGSARRGVDDIQHRH
ncbi:hypothetical protein ALC60_13245 [Trachymyrmex zeteki]|uniref:Uncharacterized protein n=1 Tax=Mycetomoellerius zeteki TaxID=64791 RepID=A0A151WJ18_9HYME|nr:hypothetical protein ALC60_13245 [Trachymyrmex zeteki]